MAVPLFEFLLVTSSTVASLIIRDATSCSIVHDNRKLSLVLVSERDVDCQDDLMSWLDFSTNLVIAPLTNGMDDGRAQGMDGSASVRYTCRSYLFFFNRPNTSLEDNLHCGNVRTCQNNQCWWRHDQSNHGQSIFEHQYI